MLHPESFFKLNGMKLILDLDGLPDKLCQDLKRVTNSPFLTLKQKISILDKMRKNYLTQQMEKNKPYISKIGVFK